MSSFHESVKVMENSFSTFTDALEALVSCGACKGGQEVTAMQKANSRSGFVSVVREPRARSVSQPDVYTDIKAKFRGDAKARRRQSTTDLLDSFSEDKQAGLTCWHSGANRLEEIRSTLRAEQSQQEIRRRSFKKELQKARTDSGIMAVDHATDFEQRRKAACTQENKQLLKARSIKSIEDHYHREHFNTDPSEVKVVKTKHTFKHHFGSGQKAINPTFIEDQKGGLKVIPPKRI